MVMKLSTHSFTLTSPAEVAGMRCGCSEEQSSEVRGVQPNSILERSCSAHDENVAISLARSMIRSCVALNFDIAIATCALVRARSKVVQAVLMCALARARSKVPQCCSNMSEARFSHFDSRCAFYSKSLQSQIHVLDA